VLYCVRKQIFLVQLGVFFRFLNNNNLDKILNSSFIVNKLLTYSYWLNVAHYKQWIVLRVGIFAAFDHIWLGMMLIMLVIPPVHATAFYQSYVEHLNVTIVAVFGKERRVSKVVHGPASLTLIFKHRTRK